MNTENNETILIVEDNDIDTAMLTRILLGLRPSLNLIRAEDGRIALKLLQTLRPKLILMDIRMPVMDGRETLKAVKENKAISYIPIIMLSTSEHREDIDYCYLNHANAYMKKEHNSHLSRRAFQSMLDFWIDTTVAVKTDNRSIF